MKVNKQRFIDHVKSIYPEMIEDYWFENGELHFYKNERHSDTMEPYSCIEKNGKFHILTEF